jgi:cytochrome P450
MPFNFGPSCYSHFFVDSHLDAGPGICAGRALAMHEMRAVLFALVRRFDLRFAKGFIKERWFQGITDHYTYLTGKLDAELKERK